MAQETTEIIKEFPSSKAGERIGWVSTDPYDKEGFEPGLTRINMVTATVGEEGARLVHRYIEQNEKTYTIPEQAGFLAISGISATISPRAIEEPYFEMNYRYSVPERHSNYDDITLSSGIEPKLPKTGKEHKEWAAGSSDLIDLLKQKMTDAELAELYPQMYYWLNGTINLDSPFIEPLRDNALDIEDLLMPDGSMKKTTNEQMEVIMSIIAELKSQMQNDENMKRNLTVFGNTEAGAVASEFEASRRNAHESEVKITQHMSDLVLRRLVYIPTGQGKLGRSWPYMDAGTGDEQAAFGPELQSLRNGNVIGPNFQLGREIKELLGRSSFAQDAYLRLRALSGAES